MKNIIKTILLLFIPLFGWAQDSVLNLSTKNYDLPSDGSNIGNKEGWVFHKGNDINWAKENIDLSGWEKLKPADLS
ncbi:MAG: hypothetical protein KKB15_06025, partial [Bacteroidetes bacterium]|nr:hypothetical protein [Bacteroidota bacterium]